MKTKYKIRRENSNLSEEETNKFKNFNNIIGPYNQVYNYKKATQPLYKNKKLFGLIMLILIVLLAIILG